MWVFISPTSHAFLTISSGQVPSLSYSQATGRISFSAKSCAISRRFFCSSFRVKSTTLFLLEKKGRASPVQVVARRQIDWSVNVVPRSVPSVTPASTCPGRRSLGQGDPGQDDAADDRHRRHQH